jgi:ubiquinol-cytochrome c reductase cytochrome b subunit
MIHKPRPARALDERLGFAATARTALAKVFPDHWSFMLGEVALYSFVVLLVTGTYLAVFFESSTSLRPYTGSYAPMHGREVSAAYASSVDLSWDVRGGLLIRQTHHWAAHLFIGAIVLHLLRIFLTGMFRKPRELNWVIGLTLLLLAIFNAFAGYSLPDDLLSGTGLRIFDAILRAVPFVGDWLSALFFGGEFPGKFIIPRLYALHIFVVPAVLAGLIGAHLAILVRQKHSHFAGPGRRDSNVVGSRVWPAYALRSVALFAAVFGVLVLAGGLLQINPIWLWGDYEPQTVTSPAVADWYILWIEGALRLFPPVEFGIAGHLIPNQFWPGVFTPGVVFGVLFLWPWLERRATGDRSAHHVAQRPREAPVRVGITAAAVTFLAVLLAAGSMELPVEWLHWRVNVVRVTLRVLVLVLPVVVGVVAWWLALSLRRSDKAGALELGRRDVLPHRDRGKGREQDPREAAAEERQEQEETRVGTG